MVKHRVYPFRGVIFDVSIRSSTIRRWYQFIPEEIRPSKEQPFYHLFAENADTEYVAYVSEQNLLPDHSGEPLRHPEIKQAFLMGHDGRYKPRHATLN